jgi:L-alanine-DL-glutamate epimerase-like enolase superfamily enzyme
MKSLSRRELVRMAVVLPAAGLFTRYKALAAPNVNRVKMTNIRAMAIRNIAGNCLIRIDTDSGVTGYGEAGATGPMARARIETMKSLLIGKDPLQIEVHFQNMTTLMHTYMAHIPTISGIDMALWDLAGKLLGAPVSTLLGARSATPFPCTRTASTWTCWTNLPAATGRSALKRCPRGLPRSRTTLTRCWV